MDIKRTRVEATATLAELLIARGYRRQPMGTVTEIQLFLIGLAIIAAIVGLWLPR